MSNCRKHAKASKAKISLKFEENQIRMAVIDNGLGFNLEKSIARSNQIGSLGLISMQERARLIDANLKIDSKPGGGTAITVEKSL